jgi:uncharacterized damage-inducible protein DinB
MPQGEDVAMEHAGARRDPESGLDERATLGAFLRYERQTLILKAAGLDAAGLARRSVEPSSLSLLGLVRHMADMERIHFRRILAGQDVPMLYWSRESPDQDFNDVAPDPEMVKQAWANWHEEVVFAERFVAAAPNLDISGVNGHGESLTLRHLLVHMIEEYARHNGARRPPSRTDRRRRRRMITGVAQTAALTDLVIPVTGHQMRTSATTTRAP